MKEPSRAPDGPDLPLVTVAVLAYNRRDPLRITLTKLRDELDWPAGRLEVIVVDNASTDGTADMVRSEFGEVQLIRREVNIGISGWNRAFEAGAGDWFLVLDDDCYITGDALHRAIAGAREHGADLVSFKVKSSDEDLHVFNEFYDTGLLAFWGCSALLSGRAARELGGFDPGIFIWGHEAEFVARLLDRGWRHLHLPEVVSVHMKSPAGFRRAQHKRNLRSFGYIAGKLLRPRDLFPAAGNLLLRVLTESVRRPAIITCMPAVAGGLRDGLRNRAPVRPVVSQLYRHNFIEFSSPLIFARGPLLIWRQRGRADLAELDAGERRDSFWRERAACYPQGTGSLSV
jgi:GT2 family glycosyltransferase